MWGLISSLIMVLCRSAGILTGDSVPRGKLGLGREDAQLRRSVTKMKKLIVLLLALGIVGAFVGGCSGGGDAAEGDAGTATDPAAPEGEE